MTTQHPRAWLTAAITSLLAPVASAGQWSAPGIALGDWTNEDGRRVLVEPLSVREVEYQVPTRTGSDCWSNAVWEMPAPRAGVDEYQIQLYMAPHRGSTTGSNTLTFLPDSEDPGLNGSVYQGAVTVTHYVNGYPELFEVLPAITEGYHYLAPSIWGESILCEDARPWFDSGEYFGIISSVWNAPGADLTVSVHTTVDEQEVDHVEATFLATVTNIGTEGAGEFSVKVFLPDQIHYVSGPAECTPPTKAARGVAGGIAVCGPYAAPPEGVFQIPIVGRVTNKSDLSSGVRFSVNDPATAEESEYDNNSYTGTPEITFVPADFEDTEDAMAAFRSSFNYNSAMFQSVFDDFGGDFACTTYGDEIFDKALRLHAQDPSVFENLSYGRITSAPLDPSQGNGGHDGVVFYLKGSDYQQSGIVVHGTAGVSRYGIGTTFTGEYYDTEMWYFQSGSPKRQESRTLGRGFEGYYLDGPERDPVEASPTCAFPPGAVGVSTNSPVDLHITDSAGRRVQTAGHLLAVQELPVGVHAYGFEHDDGTPAWTLLLPIDTYDIELIGTGEGPYTLTLTAWDDQGEPVEVVHEGTASVGSSETFELEREAILAAAQEVKQEEEAGCGCAAAGGRTGAWVLAVVVAVLGRRRRPTDVPGARRPS
jgi:MYXO-CTERM domain-containing protein